MFVWSLIVSAVPHRKFVLSTKESAQGIGKTSHVVIIALLASPLAVSGADEHAQGWLQISASAIFCISVMGYHDSHALAAQCLVTSVLNCPTGCTLSMLLSCCLTRPTCRLKALVLIVDCTSPPCGTVAGHCIVCQSCGATKHMNGTPITPAACHCRCCRVVD